MNNQTKNNKPKQKKAKAKKSGKKAAIKSLKGNFIGAIKTKLSPCAEEYLYSLENPFTSSGRECVPMLPSFPSRKMKVWAKGSLTIGTGGWGFIYANPAAANNLACIAFSGATFTGSAFAFSGTGVTTATNNSDYTASQFTSAAGNLQCRLVSFGIRAFYSGTELTKGGEFRVIEEPNHADLTALSAINLDGYDKTCKFQMTRKWICVTYHPIFPTDLDYAASGQPLGTNSFLGILINASAANTFDWEYYCNFEVIGAIARGKTPSVTDTVGVDAVLNVTQSKAKDGYSGEAPKGKLKGAAESVMNSMMSGASSLLEKVGGTMLPDLMELGASLF